MSKEKIKRLGTGLSALLGPEISAPSANLTPQTLAVTRLQAGKYQPRTHMDEASLQELAASIAQHGIMQPIVVRKLATANGPITHEIIAGERRFRAAKLAAISEVPIIERDVPDKDALALALIENIQREDLAPLEEAQAIARLLKEFSFTHEQAAQAIGRSRSATTNILRLLDLASPVQTMLNAGDIDMGHARTLLVLSAAEQILAANQIHAKKLSVREAEKLVAQLKAPQKSTTNVARNSSNDRDTSRLEEALSDRLGTSVAIKRKARGGEIRISFTDPESFEDLLTQLSLQDLLNQ